MSISLFVAWATGMAVVGMEPLETQHPSQQAAARLSVLEGPALPTAPARTSTIPEPLYLAVFGTGILLLLRRRRG